MQKPKPPSWTLFAALSLASCQTPGLPDFPVCHVLVAPSPACERAVGEESCGYCIYYRSGRELFVGEGSGHQLGGKPWSQIRAESVLLPAAEGFAPLSAYLDTVAVKR